MPTTRIILLTAFIVLAAAPAPSATGWKVVAWNDLGMHCTDGVDFSVFAILPPYNTIHAQVIGQDGKLVTSGGTITVTYEAVADPNGSINTVSSAKTNFWTYAAALFGTTLTNDTGLAGKAMPGASNTPQPMDFESGTGWFTATGIPITPYDDAGKKNYYPMMRVVVRDSGGNELASSTVVLPVSDEMDCLSCHASLGRFAGGDLKSAKLNILASHDSLNQGAAYSSALQQAGYRSDGLLATAQSGTPVLCARCHASNALGTKGYTGIPALTSSIHAYHSHVTNPLNGLPMNDDSDRSSCYRCHPGATTRCLRGVMGRAVQSDAQLAIQCQDCHGSMADVGNATRTGWLQEPNCQSCHIGNAVTSGGQLRFMTAFTTGGTTRPAVDQTFATNAGVPAAGFSLYRFSKGHGNLYCEACHGSTHAEYPSSDASDNVQSVALQGHAGVVAECSACHTSAPATTNGGPHGMHPVGAPWVTAHGDVAEHGTSQCQVCHGTDFRGSVLSRATDDRTLSSRYGVKLFWRGYRISCYACHNGPKSESATTARAATVADGSMLSYAGAAATARLSASDPAASPLTLRVVQQPQHGTAAIDGTTATYRPEPGFVGTDSFAFAAWNGSVDSRLGTVTVSVAGQGRRRRALTK